MHLWEVVGAGFLHITMIFCLYSGQLPDIPKVEFDYVQLDSDPGDMCRNDELSLTMSWVGCLLKDSELFILFAENSQILLKISVIPILLTFIYLVALNLLVNNQLNSSLWHIIVTYRICRKQLRISLLIRESVFFAPM